MAAQRANLMQEEELEISAYSGMTPADKVEQNIQQSEIEKQLKEQTEIAKNKLLKDIKGFEMSSHQSIPMPEEYEPRINQFSVVNPVKVDDHIKYTVKGIDRQGEFEVLRRYKEFYTLRKALNDRWPGIYIPAIPEKKVLNFDLKNSDPRKWTVSDNKEAKFVEERRGLLEKFLRELSVYEVLISSKEFEIFSRGEGEVDKQLDALPAQSPI